MTLLLDTHSFLWFCQGDTSLSAAAKTLIEDPNNRKLLSLASCWEIAIKAGLKKLTLGEPEWQLCPRCSQPHRIRIAAHYFGARHARREPAAAPQGSF